MARLKDRLINRSLDLLSSQAFLTAASWAVEVTARQWTRVVLCRLKVRRALGGLGKRRPTEDL